MCSRVLFISLLSNKWYTEPSYRYEIETGRLGFRRVRRCTRICRFESDSKLNSAAASPTKPRPTEPPSVRAYIIQVAVLLVRSAEFRCCFSSTTAAQRSCCYSMSTYRIKSRGLSAESLQLHVKAESSISIATTISTFTSSATPIHHVKPRSDFVPDCYMHTLPGAIYSFFNAN